MLKALSTQDPSPQESPKQPALVLGGTESHLSGVLGQDEDLWQIWSQRKLRLERRHMAKLFYKKTLGFFSPPIYSNHSPTPLHSSQSPTSPLPEIRSSSISLQKRAALPGISTNTA